MINKLIKNLINPLLFYADKSGNAVFRNFCIFKHTGNLYKLKLTKPEVGKILEYRFDLNRHMTVACIFISIFVYLIFIHMKLSLWSILVSEFLWIILVSVCRGICSYIYSKHLIENFGMYELAEFKPHIPESKWEEYRLNFNVKIFLIILVLALLFSPAFLLKYTMQLCLSSKTRNCKATINISRVYLTFYPKFEKIYDMRAYAKFVTRDYKGALEDYKTVLEISGKKLHRQDYVRLANLMFLEKNLNTPESAVDLFNEYATRKKMTVLDASQILWIKSMFRIENNIPETILQDYDDLISSLDSKDTKNYFYILCDRAYILYLMGEYDLAINTYNMVISYAETEKKQFADEIKTLYAERGYAKAKQGDVAGADADFMKSGIDTTELDKYEPSYNAQEFVRGY